MLHLALAAGDKRVALRAHAFLGGSLCELGDVAGARPHMLAVDSLVQEFRHGRFHWLASIGSAFEAMAGGRFEQARRLYDEARTSAEQDEARGAVMAAVPLCVACLTEQYDDRVRLESQARSALGSIGDPLSGCIGEMLIAQLHGRAGDRERAAAQLATCAAHPLFEAIEEPSWLALLTDACHLASDAKLANRLYSALLPRAERFVFLGPLTACVDLPYARHLGLLAETLGRLDDAVAHLEDAVARTAHAEMRVHLSRLKYELARTLLVRHRPGDRDRAVDLVAQARALAIELGQTGLLPLLAVLGFEDEALPKRAASAPPRFSLYREGEFWSVEWERTTVRLRDTRGPIVALREIRRVLVPGGRLVAATWRPRHELPLYEVLGNIAERHFGTPNEKRFALGDEATLRRLLAEAGFANVGVDVVTRMERHPSFPYRGSALAANFDLSALSDAEREARLATIETESIEAAKSFEVDGVPSAPARANLITVIAPRGAA
jgi:hypothetical protein